MDMTDKPTTDVDELRPVVQEKPADKPAPIVIGANLIVAKTSKPTLGGSSDGTR